MQNVISNRVFTVAVTPTITANSAYSVNYQLGGLQTIQLPLTPSCSAVKIFSVHSLDSSKQVSNYVLYYFNAAPTITSSDHSPLDIAYSELQTKMCGYDIITSATATNGVLANVLTSSTGASDTGHYVGKITSNKLYVIAQIAVDTPTYTSTSSVTFLYNIECHY